LNIPDSLLWRCIVLADSEPGQRNRPGRAEKDPRLGFDPRAGKTQLPIGQDHQDQEEEPGQGGRVSHLPVVEGVVVEVQDVEEGRVGGTAGGPRLAGAAAIAGHWKSIFTGFKGGDGMVVLVGVSLAYLNWFILIGIVVGIVFVLLFRRSVFRSSIGIFLGYGVMLALNQVISHRGLDVMLGLTALALVVIAHNILTHADHRPETEPSIIDPDLLIEDTRDVLNEAAGLSEDAILRQVIPQDDEEGGSQRTTRLGD